MTDHVSDSVTPVEEPVGAEAERDDAPAAIGPEDSSGEAPGEEAAPAAAIGPEDAPDDAPEAISPEDSSGEAPGEEAAPAASTDDVTDLARPVAGPEPAPSSGLMAHELEFAPAASEERDLDAEPIDAEPIDAEPIDAEPIDAEPIGTDGAEAVEAAPSGPPEPAWASDTAPSVGAAEPAEAVSSAVESPQLEPEVAAAQVVPEPSPLPRTAGQRAAELLARAGIRAAFTVPGESFLGLMEALPPAGIRVVSARHESGAGFMAAAQAQLTGRPALALVTRGVGASNVSIAIHVASQDSSPLIVIVGQVQRGFRGREAFQEVDLVETFGRLCRWAVEVDDARRLPAAIAEAVRHATTGRPGPVLVSVPEDVFDEPTEDVGHGAGSMHGVRPGEPDPGMVRRILHLVGDARRPAIVAGGGVLRAGASADLLAVAERLEIPIVASWRRGDVVPNAHPLYLGMAGFGAPASVRDRLVEADALLVIGSRLNEATTFGYTVPVQGTPWAHVDLAPHGTRRGLAGPAIALSADAGSFLRAARRVLGNAVLDAPGIDARRADAAVDRLRYEEASRVDGDAADWTGPGIHPGAVVASLNRLLPPEAIVTTDAGNFGTWLARGFRFRRPGTFLGSTAGAMGYALPAAIGASLARNRALAVAIAGDAGFAMTMAEIETAVRERARVIALVFDNRRHGTIRGHQEARGRGRGLATELGPVDFAAIGTALGAHGVFVESDADLEPALEGAMAEPGVSVIHLRLDGRWLSVDRVLEHGGRHRR